MGTPVIKGGGKRIKSRNNSRGCVERRTLCAYGSGSCGYYSMGYPLFTLSAERFETNLVEAAGGICVNKRLKRKGKPGVNITVDELNELNPEYMFISGFLSSPASDYLHYCTEHGIVGDAVGAGRVYNVPAGWDFGSPRWILGFMFLATTLHPEIFSFDLEEEQREFYRRFYGITGDKFVANRDFSRPVVGAPEDE